MPLRKIQQDWRIHNELGAAALFDSLFVFQQVMDKGGDRSDLWSPFDLSDEPTSAQVSRLYTNVFLGFTRVLVPIEFGDRSQW